MKNKYFRRFTNAIFAWVILNSMGFAFAVKYVPATFNPYLYIFVAIDAITIIYAAFAWKKLKKEMEA